MVQSAIEEKRTEKENIIRARSKIPRSDLKKIEDALNNMCKCIK